MENQYRKIKGYRELNQEEIDLMNAIKEKAEDVEQLLNMVQGLINRLEESTPNDKMGDFQEAEPHRWVKIAKSDLQKGFMALTRSIARPQFF